MTVQDGQDDPFQTFSGPSRFGGIENESNRGPRHGRRTGPSRLGHFPYKTLFNRTPSAIQGSKRSNTNESASTGLFCWDTFDDPRRAAVAVASVNLFRGYFGLFRGIVVPTEMRTKPRSDNEDSETTSCIEVSGVHCTIALHLFIHCSITTVLESHSKHDKCFPVQSATQLFVYCSRPT